MSLEIVERKSILIKWWRWYFFEMPKNIFKIWKNLLKFGLYYFSLPLLLATLFSHWHRYKWSYSTKGFDLGKIFETAFSNFISRLMGFILRLPIIMAGNFFEFFIFLAGIFFFLSWLFLPLLLVFAFFYGFKLLF